MTRRELRFSGFGGQGVITMAHVLGHAVSLHADMAATMTEAYGPEKTGGFSRADLVVADDEIGYPNVVEPGLFVAFSQEAFERDFESVADDGVVLVERDLIDPSSVLELWDGTAIELLTVPAVETADELGNRVVANIVMLGATVEATDFVPAETVREAIRDIVPDGTEALNERAFDRGRRELDDPEPRTEVVR